MFRVDPAVADAVALVTSMLMLSEDEARADLAAWTADHPSGAGEVVAAALHTDHGPGDVLGLLELDGIGVRTRRRRCRDDPSGRPARAAR